MSSNPMNEKEYRSSAWALLIVGGGGCILVALGTSGIIPLQLGNPYLFYGVMSAIFVLFLVMGLLSFKSARIFAEKAKADNTLMDTVEKWCLSNLKAEDIDDAVNASDEGDEEALFFGRVEYMKTRINSQFINLDQDLLDRFVDERLYDLIFGDQA